ncbi:core-binding factor subunit beta isoform 3-T4 [Macrochelys suwanniensis]
MVRLFGRSLRAGEEVGGEGARDARRRAAAAAARALAVAAAALGARRRRRRGRGRWEPSGGAGGNKGQRGEPSRRGWGGSGGPTMPRVVPDQRSKFENEEFFRKLSRECEIKYTGFRDRPHEERQARFQNACRDGRSEIVYLKAPMILNGVCVIWKGWIDLQRLDGMGCLEFDEERAQQEDALAQQAFEEARRRTREFEDRDRSHREEMEARRQQDPSPGSNLGSGDDLKLR